MDPKLFQNPKVLNTPTTLKEKKGTRIETLKTKI